MVVEAPDKDQVKAEMDRVLQSQAFRSSPRCRQFLQFVVENALEGRQGFLKERIIGVEVFGRNPNYPTEADSVVRVRATEVRKRLSQYYTGDGQANRWRIELPSGSYVPQFSAPDASPVTDDPAVAATDGILPPSRPRTRWIWAGVFAALLLVLSLLVTGAYRSTAEHHGQSADADEKLLEQFWGPALHDAKSVLICIGTPVTYTYKGSYQAAWARDHGIDPDRSATGSGTC